MWLIYHQDDLLSEAIETLVEALRAREEKRLIGVDDEEERYRMVTDRVAACLHAMTFEVKK